MTFPSVPHLRLYDVICDAAVKLLFTGLCNLEILRSSRVCAQFRSNTGSTNFVFFAHAANALFASTAENANDKISRLYNLCNAGEAPNVDGLRDSSTPNSFM